MGDVFVTACLNASHRNSERTPGSVVDQSELFRVSHFVTLAVKCHEMTMSDHVTSVFTRITLITLPDAISDTSTEKYALKLRYTAEINRNAKICMQNVI